jgi:hypothetical protein
MPRNSSGTYTAPSGQPVVSGTLIDSTVHNTLVSDIATELTDSASRTGKGGFTAPVRTADGTVAAPAHSFTSETGTGLYRIGASDLGVSIAGTKRLEIAAMGVTVPDDLTVDGESTLTGLVTLPGGIDLTGQVTRDNLPTVGWVYSSSCGAFSTTSLTYVAVTNLEVTLTTTGRPIIIELNAMSPNSALAVGGAVGAGAILLLSLYRNGSPVAETVVQSPLNSVNTLQIPPGAVRLFDGSGAGTYTFKLYAKVNNASATGYIVNCQMIAYEL